MKPTDSRVVLADGERLAREHLRRLLEGLGGFEFVGDATDGNQAVSMIRRERPDIAFMDIQLPKLDGFGVLRRLGDSVPPAVVFVTASGKHAVNAFRAGVTDYLLKPVSLPRLKEALHCVAERAMLSRHNLPLVGASPGAERLPGAIALRVDRRTVMVDYGEIERIEASNHNAQVHTTAGVHKVSEGLSALLARLSPSAFARVSRFMAVNLDFVVAFEPRSHGDQILFLKSGATVVVSRTHRSELLRKLGGSAPPE